jgi:hypothetical protein
LRGRKDYSRLFDQCTDIDDTRGEEEEEEEEEECCVAFI